MPERDTIYTNELGVLRKDRVTVRSDTDMHALFSVFKAYYPHIRPGRQEPLDHRHSDLEITSILSGAGVYTCGGQDYPFSPGDVFCHAGNDSHYFQEVFPGQTPALVTVRFDPRLIWSPGGEWFNANYLKLFLRQSGAGHQISHSHPLSGSIAGLLEEMFQECRRQDPAYDLLVKAKLMTVLATLVRIRHKELERRADPPVNAGHLAQMERSMNFILSHLESPLTLDMLAREARMSRSYYSTMFKVLNGVSVWDYITEQRINLAQYQLETTEKSVTQVSEACGFNSIANFNRAFKKLTGMTPREYRRSILQEGR